MFGRWVIFLVALTTVGACRFDRRMPMHPERPPGAWYVVSQGETLADIAARAGVPPEDILELNGLEKSEQVTPGRLIYVMEARRPEAVTPPAAEEPRGPTPTASTTPPPPMPLGGGKLRWPLENPQIGSYFGTRQGRRHEGIDLPAPPGTPVYAAATGRVVYAGNGIRGYGNLVVLQHAGDLLTVYAHNSALLVKQGDNVTVGQRVALVGQSGRASGPHLHFEVREGQIPRDPLPFLKAASGGGGAR